MLDWATSDYAQTYADSLYTTEPEPDSGIYVLSDDESGGPCVGVDAVPPRRPLGQRRRPVGAGLQKSGPSAVGPGEKEGFYGNVVSSRRGQRPIFDAAWDERPQRYRPDTGPAWAELVPLPCRRPPGAAPVPSLAFPVMSNSEAVVGPMDRFTSGGKAAPTGWPAPALQVLFVLLVIIAILLGALVTTVRKVERRLRKHLATPPGAPRAA
jgi:hypothetical protein